jgi:hypothetical protein
MYMVCTRMNNHKYVCTWYIHGITIRAINMYVHCSDVYVHVYTFTYKF